MTQFIICVTLNANDALWFYADAKYLESAKSKAKLFKTYGAAQTAILKLNANKAIKSAFIFRSNVTLYKIKHDLYDENKKIKAPAKKIKKVVKKNPIKASKKRRVKKAANLYEDFTGHLADEYEIVNTPDYDTGLIVGKCLGIMYETTRDGKLEKYCHEFKKASQPDFCISHDGQQIILVGGAYLFKDSGINDI